MTKVSRVANYETLFDPSLVRSQRSPYYEIHLMVRDCPEIFRDSLTRV